LRIERSHAKADGQADALAVAVELKPLDILPHPLGQQHRLRPAGCRQRDDELLTTVTRREITGSLAMLLEYRRDPAQALVAERMAVAVVDSLEVIDVAQQDGQRRAVAASATDLVFE